MGTSNHGRGDGVSLLAALLATVALGFVCACSEQASGEAVSKHRERIAVSDWPTEDVVVSNSVYFEDRAILDGELAVTKRALGPVLAGAELAMGIDSVLNGSARTDTLVMSERARITGTARYNGATLATGAEIVGGGDSPLSLPLALSIPSVPSVSPGFQNVLLSGGQQVTKAAGKYGLVSLASGTPSNRTHLWLSGGVYELEAITVANDAEIRCESACELRVKERVAVGSRSFIGPKGGVQGLGPGNVELLVSSGNGSGGPWGLPASVAIADDSTVHAYVLAPNGTTRLGHRVNFRGKIVTRDCVLGHDEVGQGLDLPRIIAQPQSATIREHEFVTFTVSVAEPDGVSYRWQRDGSDIPGPAGSGDAYTLGPALVTDDGAEFRVKVTNAAGTVMSEPAILTVIPCYDDDKTCDAFDDDCDGEVDEDFGPRCDTETGPGEEVWTCVNGVVHQAACSDGNVCNGVEFCQAGACEPGLPPDIDDGNSCTADTCDPLLGVQHVLLPEGAECGDGDPCNGIELCSAQGACVVETPPESSDPCWIYECDPETGWSEAPAIGASCEIPGSSQDGVCNAAGECMPQSVPDRGSLPGRLRGGFGRAPDHRLSGSKAFKSLGFFDPDDGVDDDGDVPDLVPSTGNVFAPTPPDIATRVQLSLSDYDDGMSYCLFGDSQIYARVSVDGVVQPDVLIHSFACNLIECEADTPIRWGAFGDFTFPEGQSTANFQVTFVIKSSCEADSSFDAGSATVNLDGSFLFETSPSCGSGGQVDQACWRAIFDPQFPSPPAPELCFQWRTSFVDEFLGEDETGEPIICGDGCGSGACQYPLPGMDVGPNFICTHEQRYPARYAEVQLRVSGRAGTQTLGRHYDADGNPGAGTPVYLDENGCLPAGAVPASLLTPLTFPSDSQNSMAPLTIAVRIRSSLRQSGQADTGPGYDILYADRTKEINEPGFTPFQVVTTSLGGIDLSPLFQTGFQLSEHLPADLVDSGVRVLVPPSRITLEARTIVPGSNASAALGSMLRRLRPLRAYSAAIHRAYLGRGDPVCEMFGPCQTEAQCAGPQLCTNGVCTHCSEGSVYFSLGKVLDIGPAVMSATAPACTAPEQCEASQSCLKRSGAPCDDGVDCWCAWPEQSSWKYVIAHEAGHQLQDAAVGDFASMGYTFSGGPDPTGSATTCSCSHLDPVSNSHCLQSPELYGAALEEGFGHFLGTTTFNDPATPGAIFGYYKAVLRPDLFTSIASDLCDSAEGVCVDSPLGPEWPMALPPVPVDAEVPFKLRNNLCAPLAVEDLSTLANEHDFLQFFHAIATQGASLDMADIYAVLRTSCNGRQMNCPSGARPDQCEPCEGVCTHAPCGDPLEPTSCGRRCYSGSDNYALPDLLRWAPLTPNELDGDPTVPDVAPNTVSLVDGARRYLEQKNGTPLSQQFVDLVANGEIHGITPNLDP